jgi:hypothetical protein
VTILNDLPDDCLPVEQHCGCGDSRQTIAIAEELLLKPYGLRAADDIHAQQPSAT